MNGEPRTDPFQLITQAESLSGDDDLAPARPTLIRRHCATRQDLSGDGEQLAMRRCRSATMATQGLTGIRLD